MKNLIIVDVQPTYSHYSKHIHGKLVEYTKNNKFNSCIIFFNDESFIGYDTRETVLANFKDMGFTRKFLNRAIFVEKDYAFFRNWMDSGVGHNQIVHVVKYMINNGIFDSRDIEDWDEVYAGTNFSIEEHSDMENNLYIPVWDYKILERYDNYILTGGQFAACLAEIRILLEALDKKYEVNYDLIY